MGFNLGFEGIESTSHGMNSPSIHLNPNAIINKIEQEKYLNRIEGPFQSPPFDFFKVSPLALKEKKNSGKYRLLHNLSYPYDENSVNKNIPLEKSKVTYSSLSSAIKLIQQNKPCYLAKCDIADAFRLIPLHPSQYHLTGFFYDGYYYDKCLPQGCSSSCKIFERFSDSLLYILKFHYSCTNVIKVLDDFLFIAETREQCEHYLKCFHEMS